MRRPAGSSVCRCPGGCASRVLGLARRTVRAIELAPGLVDRGNVRRNQYLSAPSLALHLRPSTIVAPNAPLAFPNSGARSPSRTHPLRGRSSLSLGHLRVYARSARCHVRCGRGRSGRLVRTSGIVRSGSFRSPSLLFHFSLLPPFQFPCSRTALLLASGLRCRSQCVFIVGTPSAAQSPRYLCSLTIFFFFPHLFFTSLSRSTWFLSLRLGPARKAPPPRPTRSSASYTHTRALHSQFPFLAPSFMPSLLIHTLSYYRAPINGSPLSYPSAVRRTCKMRLLAAIHALCLSLHSRHSG